MIKTVWDIFVTLVKYICVMLLAALFLPLLPFYLIVLAIGDCLGKLDPKPEKRDEKKDKMRPLP